MTGSVAPRKPAAQRRAEILEPTLVALGDACGRLLRSHRTVGLVVMQGYAAAADESVREAVGRRHLQLQHLVARLSGADMLQVRTLGAGPPGVRCAVVTSGRRKTEFPSAPPEIGLVESLASVAWTWIGESGERGATRSSPCC